jgi:ABC-2 type transport system ATP-binding protein
MSTPYLDLKLVIHMSISHEIVARVDGLCKHYNGTQVLKEVSLQIATGEFYVLMGPNGSGKSTLLSIIAGTNSFESGIVEIDGNDICEDRLQARACIGYVPQESFCSDFLTGRENLRYFAGLLGLEKAEQSHRIDELLKMMSLEADADRRVAEYSGGMRKKLEIATALLTNVRVLLLDEPSTGLDPAVRKDFLNLLTKINETGTAILLVTHIGEDAERASRVGLMVRGRIIAEGPPAELKATSGLQSSIIVDAAPRNDELMALLAGFSDDGRVVQQNGGLALTCGDSTKALPRITDALHQSGFVVARVETRPPDLEDVFYHVAGIPVRGDA